MMAAPSNSDYFTTNLTNDTNPNRGLNMRRLGLQMRPNSLSSRFRSEVFSDSCDSWSLTSGSQGLCGNHVRDLPAAQRPLSVRSRSTALRIRAPFDSRGNRFGSRESKGARMRRRCRDSGPWQTNNHRWRRDTPCNTRKWKTHTLQARSWLIWSVDTRLQFPQVWSKVCRGHRSQS